jgi:hypothetical protein
MKDKSETKLSLKKLSQRNRIEGPGTPGAIRESLPLPSLQKAMAVVVSMAILGCSLYIILSGNYDESSKKWAFGSAGTILGYWLRGR